MILGGQAHHACLVDRARERLFTEDVFALFHGRHRRHRMGVVGSAHHHRVDLFVDLGKHLAKVLVVFHLGILSVDASASPLVDVADCHDVLARDPVDVVLSSSADADRRNVKELVGLVAEGHATAADQETSAGRAL